MTGFPVKINRLSLETDGDIFGQAFVADAEKELKNRLGTIFGLTELINVGDDVADKFWEIIEDLQTEYYLPPFEIEYGLEKRFEECLQRANRRLFKMLQESINEIELDSLNALIGLSHKNKIYLSRIGYHQAFLFHFKKKYEHVIIDIFSQAGEKKIRYNPEKMFSNIVSGALTVRDNLFICNNAILEYLSQSQLMEIAEENSSLAMISEVERFLKLQGARGNFYSIIIQPEEQEEGVRKVCRGASDETTADRETPSQHSINRLINTQERTEKYLTPSLLPNWKKFLIVISSGLAKLGRLVFKYLKLGFDNSVFVVKDAFSNLLKKIRPAASSLPTESQLTPPENKIVLEEETSEPANEEPIEDIPIDEPIVEENLLDELEMEEPEPMEAEAEKEIEAEPENIDFKEEPTKRMRLHFDWRSLLSIFSLKKLIHPSQTFSNFLNRQLAKFFSWGKPKRALAIVLFVIVYLFCQSLVWQGHSASLSSLVNIDDLTKQLEEKVNSAAAQNIFNDEAGARKSLAEASELLQKIPDSRKYRQLRDDWQNKIDNLNQELQKVTYLENPKVVADLKNQNANVQAEGLAKIGAVLFTFDRQNQNLYKIDLANAQTVPINPNKNLGNISRLETLNNNAILLFDGDKQFFRYNLNQKTTEKVLTSDVSVKDFVVYGDKLYTLKTSKNQVYKHLPTNDVFNSGSAWIKDGTSAKEAVAIGIDGGIFLVNKTGEIVYLASGKKQESFQVAVNPPLAEVDQAQTAIDSSYLYLLNKKNKRLVVLDKKGNLKTQLISKDFGEIKASVVSEKDKIIYILADNKIYQIDLKF